METSRSLVIKVKYGDMLRRFSPSVNEELDLSMDVVRRKIQSLFSLDPSADLMLTYIDEDGDSVALVDDDDLNDAVKQALNPLRITVKFCSEKNNSHDAVSSGSSTSASLPQVKSSTQNLNTGVSELLRAVPDPLRDSLVKLSSDLTSEASASAPVVTDILDSISKMGLSYMNWLKEIQPSMQSSTQSGVPGSMAATGTRDTEFSKSDPVATQKAPSNVRSELSSNNECSEKLKTEGTMGKSVTGGSTGNPLPDSYVEAVRNYSQKINVGQPSDYTSLNPMPASVNPKSGVPGVGKQEKAKDLVECNTKEISYSRGFVPYIPPGNALKLDEPCVTSSGIPSATNKVATGEKVNSSNQDKLESSNTNVGVPDPKSVKDVEVRRLSGNVGARSFDWALSPVNECPFSGATVENVSSSQPVPASVPVLFRRSISQNDGSRNVFHRGVRCDGCGIHPIVGPRFTSKIKVDYDLCSTCFERIGVDSDYIRMDVPVAYRGHVSFRGYPGSQVCRGPKVKSVPSKLDSQFIRDVNVIDGTVMEPLTPFTKIWRMKNNGMVVWCQGIRLVWIGGDRLSNALSVELEIPSDGLWMNQEIDVAVEFTSPKLPGRYISYWQMATPSGEKFGQRVWVFIQVDAFVKESPRRSVESPRGSIRNLNLNLPPLSSSTGAEIINVNPEPTAGDNHLEPDNSNKKVELVQPSTEQELKFPINDSLLVGNMASNSANPSTSSVSYPIIDLAEMIPPLPLLPSPVYYPLPEPVAAPPKLASPVTVTLQPEVVLEKEQIEDKLLRELEEMGFKQVNLNKEVLRMNEYDLESTVTDLCGITEWDPMLEELEEMGFHDRQMNKMLLKKNNGSIKRVVMDLITGETN